MFGNVVVIVLVATVVVIGTVMNEDNFVVALKDNVAESGSVVVVLCKDRGGPNVGRGPTFFI